MGGGWIVPLLNLLAMGGGPVTEVVEVSGFVDGTAQLVPRVLGSARVGPRVLGTARVVARVDADAETGAGG